MSSDLVHTHTPDVSWSLSRRGVYQQKRAGYDLHLLPAEDEALLDGWDAFLLLDPLLNLGDLVVWLNVQLYLFACQRADPVFRG